MTTTTTTDTQKEAVQRQLKTRFTPETARKMAEHRANLRAHRLSKNAATAISSPSRTVFDGPVEDAETVARVKELTSDMDGLKVLLDTAIKGTLVTGSETDDDGDVQWIFASPREIDMLMKAKCNALDRWCRLRGIEREGIRKSKDSLQRGRQSVSPREPT